MKNFRWKFLAILFLFFVLTSLWVGKRLDLEAEQKINQCYPRNTNGVIEGLQTIEVTGHGNGKEALILLHGFLGSPDNYSELVEDIKNKIHMDIYVPLLPFHGRNLEAASQLNNQKIIDFVKQYINVLSKKYQSLTVLGHSYGGTILVDLAREKTLPSNVNLILYSPAVFIKSNTFFGRLEAQIYGYWRKYCNYAYLGCRSPNYESGDQAARFAIDKEKTLRYQVIPAVLQLYQLDLVNREALSHINKSYSLIIAADDNRIDFEKQKSACYANKQYCQFFSFSSGRHMLHWGANKAAFENLLMKLLNSPTA